MIAKFFIIVALILIIASLASAFIHLQRDRNSGQSTVHALTWRIGLSIGLIICLIVASQLGIIQPHGLGQAPAASTGEPKR